MLLLFFLFLFLFLFLFFFFFSFVCFCLAFLVFFGFSSFLFFVQCPSPYPPAPHVVRNNCKFAKRKLSPHPPTNTFPRTHLSTHTPSHAHTFPHTYTHTHKHTNTHAHITHKHTNTHAHITHNALGEAMALLCVSFLVFVARLARALPFPLKHAHTPQGLGWSKSNSGLSGAPTVTAGGGVAVRGAHCMVNGGQTSTQIALTGSSACAGCQGDGGEKSLFIS